jgi:predicted metal-dependent hydrolase
VSLFFNRVKHDLFLAGGQGLSNSVPINSKDVPISYRRNTRAKNYVLYVRSNGAIVVTIPRHGSASGAEQFVHSRKEWIQRTLQRLQTRPVPTRTWAVGTEVTFRGQLLPLQIEQHGEQSIIRLGTELIPRADSSADLRPSVERHLQRLAKAELPARVLELAQRHQSPVRKIAIRDQRSRWGSCSRRGTISLNWRLVQVPGEVCDYIILHELMHLHEMNHSVRFWRRVQQVCPAYKECEVWLKQHRMALGF